MSRLGTKLKASSIFVILVRSIYAFHYLFFYHIRRHVLGEYEVGCPESTCPGDAVLPKQNLEAGEHRSA